MMQRYIATFGRFAGDPTPRVEEVAAPNWDAAWATMEGLVGPNDSCGTLERFETYMYRHYGRRPVSVIKRRRAKPKPLG